MEKEQQRLFLQQAAAKEWETAVHKQYLLIKDRPVIYYTLQAFEDSEVDEVILVTGADEVDYCRKEIVEAYRFKKVRDVVAAARSAMIPSMKV